MKLCKKYRVKRLDIFGSDVGDKIDPETSDLDFLVTFKDLGFGEAEDTYFDLLGSLEKLLDHHIDRVMVSAIKNLYFRKVMEGTRTLRCAA